MTRQVDAGFIDDLVEELRATLRSGARTGQLLRLIKLTAPTPEIGELLVEVIMTPVTMPRDMRLAHAVLFYRAALEVGETKTGALDQTAQAFPDFLRTTLERECRQPSGRVAFYIRQIAENASMNSL